MEEYEEINSKVGIMEKKKILLRLDPKLHEALRKWAEEDFRSVNSHIEFLLKKALKQGRREDESE
jgi:hypothetical protein